MLLDLSTLLAVSVFTSAVAGCLLLLSWLQSRNVMALAMWAAGFMMGSVATALISARGQIPDLWSIAIANAMLAAAYGLIWGGVRRFGARTASVPTVLAGALVWLLACQFEWFYTMPRLRVVLMSAIVVVYSLLAAFELWRLREKGLASRWPLIVLLTAHAAIFLLRIPLAGALPLASNEPNDQTHWFALLVFETIFNGFCVAYFFGTMARERVVLAYQQASLTDALTGVANRRGFFERSEKLLRRAVLDGRVVAVMIFDLDRFKEINDTLGHHAGDRILECFSRVATSVLRANDPIGRIGGEEFACIVVDSSHGEAMRIAERVRSEFAAAAAADAVARDATVSVGVAMSGEGLQDLNALIKAADQALYRAKEQGRNRVEMSPVTPLLARRRPAGA